MQSGWRQNEFRGRAKNIAHDMKRHIFSDGERARWRVVEGDKKNASRLALVP